MLRNLKLRTKVLLMLLFISLITSGIVGTIVLTLGTSTLEKESYKKLTAIRELKANQIENYFQQIFDQVISFSEDRMVIEATINFKNGFDNVLRESGYSPEDLMLIDSVLYSYYQSEFLEKLLYRDSAINYFSIPSDELAQNKKLWLENVGDNFADSITNSGFPHISPSEFSGNLNMSGSSTVSSLANHIIKLFNNDGAQGKINYRATSTLNGIKKLVHNVDAEIVGSSHILNTVEENLFLEQGYKPISFRIGTDALVVVVSEKNTFINNLSTKELKEAFTTAMKWSDINPDWPDKLISRFIPSEGSGSYSLFSEVILGGDQKVLPHVSNTSTIKDGVFMKERMLDNPFTIAFFSYNYYDPASHLKIIEIDGLKLNNSNVSNNSYPLIRPLYLITTETKLKTNKNVEILLNYFINTIDEEVGINLDELDYWPQHANHRVMQYQFIANNPFPNGEKSNLSDAKESSGYNVSHQLYHPIFKNYLDRFGYYDIFIIDADSGHIIYSTSKEVDFATDLLHGPYSETNLSDIFKQVVKSDDPNSIFFQDFSPYLPSYNAPASFIASPIFDGDNKIGVLVFQLPIDKINYIMTDGYEWENVGLGNTGETYLVGSDYLIRNQSRFLIEDPETYFQTLENTNLPNEIIAKIKILNNTIGLQPVITTGTQAALKGETGTQVFSDYRGVEVMSAYKPLDVDQVNWVIMSEIDKEEAFATIPVMIRNFLYWFVLLLVIVFILSYLFARSISKPVHILTQRASELAKGNLNDPIIINRTDEIGVLANNFEKMRGSIKDLVADLKDINQNLENKVNQRTKELKKAKEAADTILDKSPVPVAVVDMISTKFLRVNEAMTVFNKLSVSELLEKNTLDIYYESEKDRAIVMDHLREYGKVENQELHLRRIGTGEERWGLVSIHPISYLGQEVYITSIIDITERKKSEEALYAANQQIQGIVDSLADALIIINEKGIIESVSPSAEKMFQYNNNEIAGLNINKLMPSPHSANHDKYIQSYIKTGEAKIIGKEREVVAIRKDGSEFPARLMISEVLTGSGRLFVGLIGDLTDRKKSEKRLKSQSAALKSAANGIVITNIEGEIEWVNPAFTKLTGYTWKEVIGKNPRVLNSGKHDTVFFENMWNTILKGEVWHDEIINKKNNGELFHEEMTITPILNDEKEIVQFVAIKQDITERKQLEAIVIKAKERMESELNIAKDIQMSMLPLIFPAFPKRSEIDIYAELIPAREVGGDFYDFYFLDENHICFVVGDVSGKGVPAALMMAVTKTLLKSQAGNDKSTASIITHVNNEIAKDNDNYMFITVFMAILNTNTGELVYSNAGHNPSFIIEAKSKNIKKLSDLHGPVVGAMEDMTYKESKVNINKDDIILAYTDGITEAQNLKEELYSDARFIELLENRNYNSTKTLTKEIVDSVKEFENGAEQFDDITVLAVQYCQEPNTISSDSTYVNIKNKLKEITTVITKFETFGTVNNLSIPIIQKFNIVFDELLSNIISYGYNDSNEHIIEMGIELKSERLIITITDDGIPFNPFQKDPPDTMLSVDERSIGGLGIHIVKNLMDEYGYKRNADKNIITLVKHNINT